MKPTRESVLKIVNASATAFDVDPKEIYGSSRIAKVVDARSCAMHLSVAHVIHNQSEVARLLGLKANTVQFECARIKRVIEAGDERSEHIKSKLAEISIAAGIGVVNNYYPPLKSEDLNCLAGCNIAGRVMVAQGLIKDKAYQRAHEELDDLLKFVNAPQHHTAKVVIATKDGLGEVKEQPDYIDVEFVKQ